MSEKIKWNQSVLHWVAGIVEGEGCLSPLKRIRTGPQPRIRVAMSDNDIIQRLADSTGIGRVTGPTYAPSKVGMKPVYCWDVSKKSDIYRLLLAIYPILGERRKTKVREIIL